MAGYTVCVNYNLIGNEIATLQSSARTDMVTFIINVDS